MREEAEVVEMAVVMDVSARKVVMMMGKNRGSH